MASSSSTLLLSLPVTSSTVTASSVGPLMTVDAATLSSTGSPDPNTEYGYHSQERYIPVVYAFSSSSFPFALSTAIIFFILSFLHTYLCVKKKTIFFAITIYASLAMATAQTLKSYLVQLQATLLSPSNFNNPDIVDQFEHAGVLLIVMELLEAVPASAMGFLLMMTYTRLTWFIVPKSGRKKGRVLGLPVRWQTSILALGQMVGDALVGVGHYYGFGFLQSLGGVIGLMTWGWLAGLVVRLGRVKMEEGRRVLKEVKKFVWVVGGAVGLLLVCGIARVIRREQVSYLMYGIPWISSEDDESVMFAMAEWPVYVFQHLPIALMLVLLAVYHPGDYLPRRLTGWRLKTKRLLREERMREDVENLKVLARKDSKSSSVQDSELDCFERVDLDKEAK
ncbi:hypothetical protein QBC36DRAFT_358152 [Triangularia setosa]|uniref:Uncharacterized protein n=1 Tax=Triangularia setosa TaxID=2587417 RepID=A0AAN6W2I2_9PEZI|nr:hypothetical protein QBC36DRAFT_358152 [Podospora setosa]